MGLTWCVKAMIKKEIINIFDPLHMVLLFIFVSTWAFVIHVCLLLFFFLMVASDKFLGTYKSNEGIRGVFSQ